MRQRKGAAIPKIKENLCHNAASHPRLARPMPAAEKKIIIIAGPNGAGKTTFAREFLPEEAECPVFINADTIAQGLAQFAPQTVAVRAGRIMLKEIREQVLKGGSFAFETTLSGRLYARLIPQWQSLGYSVRLYYLKLHTPDLAVERVAQRVRKGGHHIPEAVIRRRFVASGHNLQTLYKPIVDEWRVYDNSALKPTLLETGGKS